DLCARGSLDMPPPHPRATLFPYTTLFRSALGTLDATPLNALRHPATKDSCGWYVWGGVELSRRADFFSPMHVKHLPEYAPALVRSEEHTSELQSLRHLVCRLLLEKKHWSV